MDDYSITTLAESKNEWCARLVNVTTPCIIEGLKSIFNEALKLCLENDEEEKYLMTFQNFLSRVPKWNTEIINQEKDRVLTSSACGYMEDLITCVHIIQLKALTCTRVGTQQKKVDINIPSLADFIHKVYINVARKVYTNIYLFEKDILPLQIQKNNRELEIIIKELILNTVRDNIPVETILRAYLDETEEQSVQVIEKKEVIPVESVEPETKEELEVKAEKKEEEKKAEEESKEIKELIKDAMSDKEIKIETDPEKIEKVAERLDETQNIQFSNTDIAVSTEGIKEEREAPKDIETLNEISRVNNEKRKEEEADDEDEDEALNIGDEIKLDLNSFDDLSINPKASNDILLKDIEVL
jgi:hypothetical protein